MCILLTLFYDGACRRTRGREAASSTCYVLSRVERSLFVDVVRLARCEKRARVDTTSNQAERQQPTFHVQAGLLIQMTDSVVYFQSEPSKEHSVSSSGVIRFILLAKRFKNVQVIARYNKWVKLISTTKQGESNKLSTVRLTSK